MDGSLWHTGMAAKQGFCLLPVLTAMILGCRGVPQTCLVQRAQRSPTVTALLSHGGLRCHLEGTGVVWVLCPPRVRSRTATELAGLC